jgi:hypothetical protein
MSAVSFTLLHVFFCGGERLGEKRKRERRRNYFSHTFVTKE